MEQSSEPRARTDAHFDFNDLRMIALFWIFQFEICLGIGHWDLELEIGYVGMPSLSDIVSYTDRCLG